MVLNMQQDHENISKSFDIEAQDKRGETKGITKKSKVNTKNTITWITTFLSEAALVRGVKYKDCFVASKPNMMTYRKIPYIRSL